MGDNQMKNYNQFIKESNKYIDSILDKISEVGYDNLTDKEKNEEKLFMWLLNSKVMTYLYHIIS